MFLWDLTMRTKDMSRSWRNCLWIAGIQHETQKSTRAIFEDCRKNSCGMSENQPSLGGVPSTEVFSTSFKTFDLNKIFTGTIWKPSPKKGLAINWSQKSKINLKMPTFKHRKNHQELHQGYSKLDWRTQQKIRGFVVLQRKMPTSFVREILPHHLWFG